MNARRIGAAIGAVTLVASGSYVFVYLYRWEWNRALISGVFFLAAEVGLATLLLASRMQRVAAQTASVQEQLRQQRVLAQIQATAPPPRDHFAWIRRSGQLNVFVPVLLGAGVLMSGLAWCVERLSRLTAGPALEQGLARRLGTLSPPAAGFVPVTTGPTGTAAEAIAFLRRPVLPQPGTEILAAATVPTARTSLRPGPSRAASASTTVPTAQTPFHREPGPAAGVTTAAQTTRAQGSGR